MQSSPEPRIRPIEEVVREHIEATLALHFPGVPQYRIAMELGISPVTLIRFRKRLKDGAIWAKAPRVNGKTDESVVKDRR